MATKSAVQKLIEQYEASIVEHQRAIDSATQFIEALKATQKAKARVKPRVRSGPVQVAERKTSSPPAPPADENPGR